MKKFNPQDRRLGRRGGTTMLATAVLFWVVVASMITHALWLW